MSKELFQEQQEREAVNHSAASYNDVINYLARVEHQVEEGQTDVFVMLHTINKIEKLVKDLKSNIMNIALQEAEMYDEKTFNHKNLTIEKRNGRKTYSFKHIEEWSNLNTQIKDYEAKLKHSYDSYLKNVVAVNEETGEALPIPEVKYSQDTLIIKSND